jgi:hypothetical protein
MRYGLVGFGRQEWCSDYARVCMSVCVRTFFTMSLEIISMRRCVLKHSETCNCDYRVPTMNIVVADNRRIVRVLSTNMPGHCLGQSQLTLYLTWLADLNIVQI